MPTLRCRGSGTLAAALSLLPAACASQPALRGPRIECAAPCAEMREVISPDTVAVDVHAPPGSFIANAALTPPAGARCASGIPAVRMLVDGQMYPEGPATVDGKHAVDVAFPFVGSSVGSQRYPSGLDHPVVIDLSLRTPDGPTCLRLAVPLPAPWHGLATQNLSFRLMYPR